MKGIIEWSTRNPVAGNTMMALVLVLGFSSWFQLRKEIFPETSVNVITVQVPYPSASPEEVENGICIPVEEEVADLDGIERLSSTAAEGIGVISIEVSDHRDVRELMNDIRSRVDAIDNFPEEAEKPVIEEVLLKVQVLSLAISADTDETTLRQLAERVRDDLLIYQSMPPASPLAHIAHRLGSEDAPEGVNYGSTLVDWMVYKLEGTPSITQVEIFGVRDYEISIEVSETKLAEYGLSFDEVAEAVRSASLDLPGGSVRAEGGEVLLRVRNKRYDAQGFAELRLRGEPGGAEILLGDVAEVRDGFEQGAITANFDHRHTVLLDVYRVGQEDTLAVARLANDYLENSASSQLPEGAEIQVWNDSSVYLDDRLRLLAKNGLIGLLLVTIVLALFLRPSLALLVALGIPVAFAGALITMPISGISINMISAFGFILVLGIVVDDAIVVGENVYSRIQRGEDPRLAAPRGAHEVGMVVVFGVLTTMVAFVPMLMVSGVSGKIWPNIPWVVIPTLAFSLVQSKLVLPAHLAMLKAHDENRKVGWLTKLQRRIAGGLEWVAEHLYRPLLEWAISWRYATIALFLTLLVSMVSIVTTGRIPFAFLPNVEADLVAVKLEMAAGTSVADTAAAVAQLERAAWALNEEFSNRDGKPIVRHVLATSGTQVLQTGFAGAVPKGENLGEVSIELSSAANRDVTSKQLIGAWRRLSGPIPGATEVSFVEATSAAGNAFDLEISAGSMEVLTAASVEVREQLGQYTGVRDITDSKRRGKREALIELLPAAGELGLNEYDVASQVRQAFYGEEVQRLQRGRDELKVMVRYPEDERESLASLEQMDIRTADGREIPFAEVARYDYQRGYAAIQRANRSKSITISADVDKTVGGAVDPNQMVAAFEAEFLPELGRKYPGLSWEFRGEQKDQADSIDDLMRGFILALLGIYILLAIPLKSYSQPLIVMSAIPFGLVGAIVGHLLLGLDFSVMSMCGIVALSGVVVNDSLVLVDYVNRHRGAGQLPGEAARLSGRARFRAVILTSLTTFVGLAPMVLETDIQAKFLVPMAVALAFGILFATVITLLLVPAIYLVLEDLKRLFFTQEARERMEARFRQRQQEGAQGLPEA